MSELVVKAAESESEALSDIPDSSAVFESPDNLKTATSSSHHDSEYDTASDTPSSDLEDEEDFEDDDVDDNGEEGSVVLEQRGDDEEQDGEKKKVDDDEDRSNPQYIPKRGVFYEHDDRTAEESEAVRKADEEGKEEKTDSPTPVVKKPVKKSVDRWSHDRYNENEQAPKSRAELVNSYGYDIRNEDGPPRARRRRRYGRGPNKYTRNWEDEKAYAKLSSQQEKQPRNQQEEFPELGSRRTKPSNREEKENKNDENRRHSNKSPNQQRSHQQSQHDSGHRSHSDRYDGNRSINDKLEGNRHQIDRFDGNRSENDRYDRNDRNSQTHGDRFDGNRSQNYEINRSNSDGNRSQNYDRFDGNRQKFFENNRPQNDRYDGNRQQNEHNDGNRSNNRFDGNNRFLNDQNQDRYDNKRSSDKFDGNRTQNERYEQRMERGGEQRNWDRRGGKVNDSRGSGGGGGFRTKNTIEFKNQNRNKSFDNANNAAPTQTGSKGFNSSGFNQRQNADYETDLPVETLSFTNSKLSNTPQSMSERYPNVDYNQMDASRHRAVTEVERSERPITGRQLGTGSSRGSNAMQQSPLPITTPIHNQQPSMNIQQQISSQPIQQQPQLLPQQQQNATMLNTESRSAKRYSTLRQRTTEAVQNMSIPQQSLSLHDLHEQQMILQDAALMLQMQQSQEQIQLQPNLAHQPPSTNYSAQPMPLQLQNEYAGHGQKSQGSAVAVQSNQPSLIQSNNQSQSANQSAQYPPSYFAPNEFSTQSVPPSTSIQPAAQSTQLMTAQQYPVTQYPQPPAAPYVQPPPQTSYIQPAVNQQQQLMNYVPSIPPAQQQFSTVNSFPTYPTVPNYNAVPSGITQSGITYYPPQTQPRPILSQRRPTNAIPILAPSERFVGKGRNRTNNNQFDEDDKTTLNPPIGSPENIDHILDNMFTQRAPFQPPTRKSNSPSPESNSKSGDGVSESTQLNATNAGDCGNKQLDFADVGMGKMSLDDVSNKIEIGAAVQHQSDNPADPTSS